MLRLFAGLSLPILIRQRLTVMQGGIEGARWVERENFHLTLTFIGEVDETTAEAANDAFTALRAPAFSLSLQGTGSFARGDALRMLWIGVSESPPLQHLKDKIDRALDMAGVGFERRKKFVPHVTLARFRDAEEQKVAQFMQRHNLFSTEAFDVDTFVLFRSHLTKNGSAYEELAHYPLVQGG